MIKTISKLFILLVSMLLVLVACGGGEEQTSGSTDNESTKGESYTFKLTTIVPPKHVWAKTAEKFNEELQARSDGRMNVEIFPASQLGPEKDMVQQMGSGSVDFGFITVAYMGSRAPSFNAWFMPFLFSDIRDATTMRDSESGQKILATLDEHGLVGMDYLFTGNHHILMRDGGEMDSPDDFKGKKIRFPGSPVIKEFFAELGASPAFIPLPEVYTALQTGVIDGIDASIDSTDSQKFYEVAKDFTLLSEYAFPSVVVMSKATQDKISEEDLKIVKEAMKAAIAWGNEQAIAKDEKHLGILEKEGKLNVFKVEHTDGFNDVKKKMYEKYSNEDPLIKAFIEEAQNK